MSVGENTLSHVIVSDREGVPTCYVSRLHRDGSLSCTWDAAQARRFSERRAGDWAAELSKLFPSVRFESRAA